MVRPGPGELAHRWRIEGLVSGDSTAGVRYGRPNGSQLYATTSTVHVARPGRLVELSRIGLRTGSEDCSVDGSRVADGNCALRPGHCYEAYAVGLFKDEEGARYSTELAQGLSWTSLDSAGSFQPEPASQFCATSEGDAVLRACVGESCRTFGAAIIGDDDSQGGITVTPRTISVSQADDPTGGNIVCPPVEVARERGVKTDLTNSPAVEWLEVSGLGGLASRLHVDGVPRRDARGNPCFLLIDPGAQAFRVSYGGYQTDFTLEIERF